MKTGKAAAIGVTCLAAGLALFGPNAAAKQPQTKALQFQGYSVIMTDLNYDWVILEEGGQMTHVGRYECVGSGSGYSGSGTLTTASGDTLSWNAMGSTVRLTGETGRFTGAVGSFEVTRTETHRELDGGYLIVTYRTHGTGTITY